MEQFYDQAMQELRKNREIQPNQQTIRCQVLADMIKIWSCLIFIKLYYLPNIPAGKSAKAVPSPITLCVTIQT